jgi:hypothetical protein
VYLQALLGLQNLGQGLAGFDSECVAQEPDFFDVVVLLQGLDVRLDVLRTRELEALALEREKLRHVDLGQKERSNIKVRFSAAKQAISQVWRELTVLF